MLQRWDPFAELRHLQEAVNRLWGRAGLPSETAGIENWSIPLDVVEQEDNIIVNASLPGISRDDIQVTIDDDTLTIRAQTTSEWESKEQNYLLRERSMGSFHRSLRLPDTVDASKAKASHKDGVLSISFPRIEAKKARRLTIDVGS